MADEKVFKIVIDGLEQSYTNTVKLVDVLKQLEDKTIKVAAETDKVSKATDNSTKASKEKTKTLSDEEKAQKKLAETQEKAKKPITEMEKAQELANQQLKERTKQLKQQVAEENAATNSIAAMKAELAKLNTEWNNLDTDSDRFKELTEQINNLTTKLKEAEAAKGTFTRNVGNYQSATQAFSESIGQLSGNVQTMTAATGNMLSSLQSIAGATGTVNVESKEMQAVLMGFSKIFSVITKLNKSYSVSLAATTTAQTATTVATKTFSKALISTGIGALVVGLGLLIAHFDDVKKFVVNLVPALGNMGAVFDELKAIFMGVGKAAVDFLLTPIKTVVAVIKGFIDDGIAGAVKAGTAEFKKGINVIDNYEKGYHNQSVANAKAAAVEKAKLRAAELENTIKDNEAKAGSDWKYSEEGRKAYKALFDAKKLMYADDKEAMQDLQREEWKHIADITKHDKDELKKRTDAAKSAADKRTQILDDYKKNLESFNNETHKLELANEQKQIDSAKSKAEKLSALTKEELKKRNEAIEEAYNKQIMLNMKLHMDERKNVEKQYNELIDKAKKAGQSTERLEEEKNNRLLTLRKDLLLNESEINEEKNEKIKTSNKKYEDDYNRQQDRLRDKTKSRVNEEIKLLNHQYKTLKDYVDNSVSRLGGRFNLIDVDKTKKNLASIKGELQNYLQTLNNSKSQIESYYDNLISSYKKDSEEHKNAVEAKKSALDDLEIKIKQTTEQIDDTTKRSTTITSEYFDELNAAIQETAGNIMTGVTAIFDAVNSVMQAQLDDANEKYDAISQKYDEVVAKRKESSDRIDELEKQAQNAKGERFMALQDQIFQEMQANKTLADQEKQLAKDKEKQEKEIAKKEKQMKRAQILSDIVQGGVNTALAITSALTVKPFPLGVVLATVAGAMGAVQLGVMTSQLSKLEDGGLLKGKRHSNGGMRVEGTNIEVEGGEYVINRESTSKNIGLIKYINSQRRELRPNDLGSFFSKSSQGFEPPFKRMFETGGMLPPISNSVNIDNESLVEAIQAMRIEPIVTVADINNAQDSIVTVDNWTGL